MSQSQQAAIDHVIILLPYRDIVTPPAWITDHFTISPGGKHADGKTENKLIIFQDGTYLELIAFVDDDPDRRAGHWWDKQYGIVDYALTDIDNRFDPAVNDRLGLTGTGIDYKPPQRGGRTRPDGVQLEWEVTFPKGIDRGVIPFWCHDITPRDRRVPTTAENCTHPSGAVGIAGLTVGVHTKQFDRAGRAIAAIVDAKDEMTTTRHEVAVPKHEHVTDLRAPTLEMEISSGESDHIRLFVQVPRQARREAINQKVGEGVVKIHFSS